MLEYIRCEGEGCPLVVCTVSDIARIDSGNEPAHLSRPTVLSPRYPHQLWKVPVILSPTRKQMIWWVCKDLSERVIGMTAVAQADEVEGGLDGKGEQGRFL